MALFPKKDEYMSYTIKGEVEIQRGFGLPRHTTASRTSYTPPEKGYKVFDTDLNTEFTWSGTEWATSGGDSSSKVDKAGDTMTGELVFNSSSGGSARDYRIQGVNNNELYIGTDTETGFHSSISLGTSRMQHRVGNTGSQVLLSIESAGSTSTKYYLNDARGDSVFRYEAGVGGDIEDRFIYNVKVRSLATVLSDASTTLVTKGYMESVIPDTSGFVDLTSAQNIGGIKTFTNDVNVEGTLSTDTLSSDAASFIETETPLRYTASAVSAIVDDNELINKAYVDVQIASAAGASELDDLTDVDLTTTAVADGQALVWSSATSTFVPADISVDTSDKVDKAGDTMTGDLTIEGDLTLEDDYPRITLQQGRSAFGTISMWNDDLQLSNPGNDITLLSRALGKITVDSDPSATLTTKGYVDGKAKIEEMTDVTLTSIADGDVLTWDDDESEWVNAPSATASLSLDSLTDTDMSLTKFDDYILSYNDISGKWEPTAPPSLSQYVTLTGDQTITGTKTFESNIRLNNEFSGNSANQRKIEFTDGTQVNASLHDIPLTFDEMAMPVDGGFRINSYYAMRIGAGAEDQGDSLEASIELKPSNIYFIDGTTRYMEKNNLKLILGDSTTNKSSIELFTYTTGAKILSGDGHSIELGIPGATSTVSINSPFETKTISGSASGQRAETVFDIDGVALTMYDSSNNALSSIELAEDEFKLIVNETTVISYPDVFTPKLTLQGPVEATQPTDPSDSDLTLVTKGYVASLTSGASITTEPRYVIFTGTGNASYTMSWATQAEPDTGRANVIVFVNGIKQIEGTSKSYTVSNNVVTFTTGNIPASGDDVEIYGFGD